MNRRRAMTILGAVSLGGLPSCKRQPVLRTFSTFAFGTQVHFHTHSVSGTTFETVSRECDERLLEIESLFSLYDTESTISRLNRDGYLENPPAEFLHLVRTALEYGDKTGGVFDITVQPLWNWRQKWKEADTNERATMYSESWEQTLALVDYRNVRANEKSISFTKPGMAITLNGIVQGYATDQIVLLLRKHSVHNALVNIGEYAAIGNAPDGEPWNVELAATGKPLALPPGRALAVSAGSGHTFEPEGRLHHIFRPSDGVNTRPYSSIVVTAHTAALADTLSTTFTVASGAERRAILEKFPTADFREIKD